MVAVGELACFGGMPTGRLGVGSAFAKASGDSEVRFQLSANALNLSTCRLKSICCCFISGRSGPDTGRLIMLITVSTSAKADIRPVLGIGQQCITRRPFDNLWPRMAGFLPSQ